MTRKITRREILRTSGMVLAGTMLGSMLPGPAFSTTKKPNIVFILVDDQRNDTLGCAGHPVLKTPNIDKLAADGIRFTSGYVTGNMCGPSRAGFLTGRTQSTFGYYRNVNNPYDPAQGLPRIATIARATRPKSAGDNIDAACQFTHIRHQSRWFWFPGIPRSLPGPSPDRCRFACSRRRARHRRRNSRH